MNIIKMNKIGFCYGVSRALDIVENQKTYQNTYLLGDLVHNKKVSKDLKNRGIIVLNGKSRIELLNEIPNNSQVIITAHGVSDEVIKKCKEKNLTIIDATCPFVTKSYNSVKEYINQNYDIIFIGKENHPETEACLGISPNVHLYKKDLPIILNSKILIAYQTTMSHYDIEQTIQEIKKQYPNAIVSKMICHQTEIRQNELINLCINLKKSSSPSKNLIIVIGDKLSNNSNKLFETTIRYNIPSIFINSVKELESYPLSNFSTIYLCSGTSSPNYLVSEIENYLKTK